MDEAKDGTGRGRRIGLFLAVFGASLLGFFAFVAALGLSGRELPVPGWAVARFEARANAALAGQAGIAVRRIDIAIDEQWVPRVWLRDVTVRDPSGQTIVELPEARIALAGPLLLQGRVAPKSLQIVGAEIALARAADGSFGLSLAPDGPGTAGAVPEPAGPGNLGDLLDRIDAAFATPALAGVERIEARALQLVLSDARSGRAWRVSDGRLLLAQTEGALSLSLGFDMARAESGAVGGGGPARRPRPSPRDASAGLVPAATASLSFTTEKGSRAARLIARVEGVHAADIAAQSPALAWLSPLDAPISGAFQSTIDATGAIDSLTGSIAIGAGALAPAAGVQPVPFNAASLYFSYLPSSQEMQFTDIVLDSPSLRVKASAKAWLKGTRAGSVLPETMVGQLALTEVAADPKGLFEAPVTFSSGALDARVHLQPFAVDIGQVALIDGDRRIGAKGRIAADPAGWNVALDFDVDAIDHDRLVALWPVGLVPHTRDWIDQNVRTGTLFDVKAALRMRPEQAPQLSLGYEYRDAAVRFLKTLPPVEGGAGYATIDGDAYTMVIDRGVVTAPAGGALDVAGSVMRVPDIKLTPAPAEITIRAKGPIPAALSVLDEPPFRFMTKAGKPVDLAQGLSDTTAELKLTLAKDLKPEDVDYAVTSTLSGLRSDKIVPGRTIEAETLELRAGREGLEIAGPGRIDGLPFRALWRQGFAAADRGKGRLTGSVELSQRFVDTFGIGLPDGSISGTGQGEIEIETASEAPARFSLRSDLNRLTMRLAQIGWTKPAATTGLLSLTGTLGEPVAVERLELSAPGLRAVGRVDLGAGGVLDRVRFSDLAIGDWFSGSADLIGQGRGKPVAVAVQSGSLDLRRTGGLGAGQDAGPLTVALDRLRISETLSLTGFRGSFSSRGGFNGKFEARVNGEAPVSGTVTPGSAGRSAVRIQSADAGAVFRAAGAFSKARGGAMDLLLLPDGPPGYYRGTLDARDVRVRNASVLAELLGAISVIGLLEQLNGEGINFTTVRSDFRLTPEAIEVSNGSAVGPSLGVSMAGLYRFAEERLDMQGVISPIYFVNAIGQVISRRGEGMFGFNYRLSGSADDPKVSVNPLSILTPGAFREIFRRAPPKLKDQSPP